jgi:hypothetical protein
MIVFGQVLSVEFTLLRITLFFELKNKDKERKYGMISNEVSP